ncbi:MAG TPA: hypothetical protein VLI21_09860 [Casimicrobiaceae bacterium]|nr:hypothetical protein [Casimicrobiaceae bacterium]
MAARHRETGNERRAARVKEADRPPVRALPPQHIFYTRVRRGATYAFGLVFVTLVTGIIGYRLFEHLAWLDAFHQAAMLLSGMGPVIDMTSDAGKIFDSIYALFCGVILLASTALLFAPVIHRILHRFHIEDTSDR